MSLNVSENWHTRLDQAVLFIESDSRDKSQLQAWNAMYDEPYAPLKYFPGSGIIVLRVLKDLYIGIMWGVLVKA